MSNTNRRIAARRQAWGHGPHLLPFVNAAAASTAVEPTATFFLFPEGNRVLCPVLDGPTPEEAPICFGLIAVDGQRSEPIGPLPTPSQAARLRLHDAMSN